MITEMTYQWCAIVTVRLVLVTDRLTNRAARFPLGASVGCGVDVHRVVFHRAVANRDVRGRRTGPGSEFIHLAVGGW